ncbi:MAG TPA: hypothetical protein VFN38_14055, partial [Gemmatimonadaceae bacterium]|nr:hypothetical protein [Gemmatimonadaceae bacterium]
MLRRPVEVPPVHVYPADEWRIVESRFHEGFHARAETVLALANGYVGIRGTFDEGRPSLSPGTFVNGFHETWPIVHAEDAYGLARTGQTIVNVPDATIIRLYVDDEPLFVPTARLTHYERALDMRDGTLSRHLEWTTPAGKHVRVRSCRLVSLEQRHVAAISYEVTLLDRDAPIAITSEVLNRQDTGQCRSRAPGFDPRQATPLTQRVLHADIAEVDGDRILLGYRTAASGMTLALGVDHIVEAAQPLQT